MGAAVITSLSEAYEAAEAGNFQVSERLQSLFASPYAEHPEDTVDADHEFIDWSVREKNCGTSFGNQMVFPIDYIISPQIIWTMWF
jgi:hypothetical protein